MYSELGLYQVAANVSLQTIHRAKVPHALRMFNIPRDVVVARGRFCVIPEVIPNLLNQSYKPTLLRTIDIPIPSRARLMNESTT